MTRLLHIGAPSDHRGRGRGTRMMMQRRWRHGVATHIGSGSAAACGFLIEAPIAYDAHMLLRIRLVLLLLELLRLLVLLLLLMIVLVMQRRRRLCMAGGEPLQRMIVGGRGARRVATHEVRVRRRLRLQRSCDDDLWSRARALRGAGHVLCVDVFAAATCRGMLLHILHTRRQYHLLRATGCSEASGLPWGHCLHLHVRVALWSCGSNCCCCC